MSNEGLHLEAQAATRCRHCRRNRVEPRHSRRDDRHIDLDSPSDALVRPVLSRTHSRRSQQTDEHRLGRPLIEFRLTDEWSCQRRIELALVDGVERCRLFRTVEVRPMILWCIRPEVAGYEPQRSIANARDHLARALEEEVRQSATKENRE